MRSLGRNTTSRGTPGRTGNRPVSPDICVVVLLDFFAFSHRSGESNGRVTASWHLALNRAYFVYNRFQQIGNVLPLKS